MPRKRARQQEQERLEKAARSACRECGKFDDGFCPEHPLGFLAAEEPEPGAWKCDRQLMSVDDDEPKICGRVDRCFRCVAKMGISSGAAERARQRGVGWHLGAESVAALLACSPSCRRCRKSLVFGADVPGDDSPALYRLNSLLGFSESNTAVCCLGCLRGMATECPK